jgi:hypothetical protein
MPFIPPLLAELYLPTYGLAPDEFLVDDSSVDYQAYEAINLLMSSDSPPAPGDGDGGDTNSYSPSVAYRYTTNDLWLEITDFTNHAASLVVHRPWNDTNLTHDLYFTESLNSPIQWSFVMRCLYTNVVATDLCSEYGFFSLGPTTNGVLNVSTNVTAEQLAQLLVPPGVTVMNATYTGATEARGTFSGGNGSGLPLESGVILATGDITNAIGPNNQSGVGTWFNSGLYNGDSDLDKLVGGSPTADAAVLEFDVVSTSALALGFQYVFASEEYPEWIGDYNDPMAVFVSTNFDGTNWVNSVTNDIAQVPGITNLPVSVNSINGGCVSNSFGGLNLPTNPESYVDNADPGFSAVPPYAATAPAFNIQYDGMTVMLSSQVLIAPGVTNHVKIAIADYNDAAFDSAVFVRAWTPCP